MVTGGNVQIVWKKFLKYFDVEPRIVPLKPGNYRLTAERLEKYVGAVTSTLLATVLIGQLAIAISPNVKAVFFLLFPFAVGYGVGPQFVRGIAKDGLPPGPVRGGWLHLLPRVRRPRRQGRRL
jgi:hypothetical protein